jgi:hypothetical protein
MAVDGAVNGPSSLLTIPFALIAIKKATHWELPQKSIMKSHTATIPISSGTERTGRHGANTTTAAKLPEKN